MEAKSILSWTELTWNPHATHQPEGKLHVGDTVDINDLDLVTSVLMIRVSLLRIFLLKNKNICQCKGLFKIRIF